MTIYDKMNNEMKGATSPIEERIHLYLCSLFEDDELISQIEKKDKDILSCAKYLYHQGSKLAKGGVADVTSEMEINWIREYYTKEIVERNELQTLPATTEKVFVDKEIEKIVEIEKIIYKAPTTIEEIEKYAKQAKSIKKKTKIGDEIMDGLF